MPQRTENRARARLKAGRDVKNGAIARVRTPTRGSVDGNNAQHFFRMKVYFSKDFSSKDCFRGIVLKEGGSFCSQHNARGVLS